MSVIAVLIGFSVLVAGGFLAAFLWAVRTGQYDDRHTPAVRVLFDDEKAPGNLPQRHKGTKKSRKELKRRKENHRNTEAQRT